jgi:hypothetical protein
MEEWLTSIQSGKNLLENVREMKSGSKNCRERRIEPARRVLPRRAEMEQLPLLWLRLQRCSWSGIQGAHVEAAEEVRVRAASTEISRALRSVRQQA